MRIIDFQMTEALEIGELIFMECNGNECEKGRVRFARKRSSLANPEVDGYRILLDEIEIINMAR